MLTEGTMVERSDQRYPTEEDVLGAINTIIKHQENTTFVVSSAQNIDRLVSVFKSCRWNRKQLVLDVYNAWVLEIVRKKSEHMPTVIWDNIWVYNHPNQMEKIAGTGFDDFRKTVKNNDLKNAVFKKPEDYVYFLRCPNTKLVDTILPNGKIKLIYSQWEGYLKEKHKTYCTDIINKLVNSRKVDFHLIHTSGHATLFDLKRLAKAVNPKQIVPIHTEYPIKIKQEFNKEGIMNVEVWEDGKEYHL